jgi:hypothetical protein
MEPLLREQLVRPMGGLATDSDQRRAFWTRYQPRTRGARAPLGTAAFYADVAARRYALEPDIPFGERLELTSAAPRLGRRIGWHLWITARK